MHNLKKKLLAKLNGVYVEGADVLVLAFEGKGKTCSYAVSDGKILYFYTPVLLA